jgi:hypothetical protein
VGAIWDAVILHGCPGLHLCSPAGDGGHLTDELFPRKGAAETGGPTGTRQIIDGKGPERVGHQGAGTFAGKFHASFGKLPVVLGDQHRVSGPTAAGQGQPALFLSRNSALPAGSSGAAS